MIRDVKGTLGLLGIAIIAMLGSFSVPIGPPVRADDPPDKANAAPATGRLADQAALKPLGTFVGSWRGAGQVERGRTKGAWTENASWAWALTRESAALEVKVSKGKYLKSGLLKPGTTPGSTIFEATLADGSTRKFTGSLTGVSDSKPLVLTATGKTPVGGLRKITITPRHESRLLMLYEAETDEGVLLNRLGEVGFTREGISFAAGDSSPLCIVTEGRGATQVSYKGKTYWVCCSGCKDLFNENPEAVLADAAAREKEKKK
jgi:YHS domain-containing protein